MSVKKNKIIIKLKKSLAPGGSLFVYCAIKSRHAQSTIANEHSSISGLMFAVSQWSVSHVVVQTRQVGLLLKQ